MTTAVVAESTETPSIVAAMVEAAAVATIAAPEAVETETLPNGAIETRVVTHKYEGNDEDELSLDVGQVVNVLETEVRRGVCLELGVCLEFDVYLEFGVCLEFRVWATLYSSVSFV